MKSLIIYGKIVTEKNTRSSSGPQHFLNIRSGLWLHVRMRTFDGDISAALDAAKPEEGETVLNTLPVPE